MGTLSGIDAVTGASRALARVSTVVGETAIARAPGTTEFLRKIGATERDVPDGWRTPGGAVVGALLWGEHRVLGAITGASLARNVPALLNADDRRLALRNMGTTGAAVIGSLALPTSPILGFLAGWLGGGLAMYYIGMK